MKRTLRLFSILFALALVLAFSMVATTPVAAATRSVPGTYPTIQAAIDAANPGDIIEVAAGTYAGNINVNKSSLTIVGDPGDSSPGPGASAPIIDGGGAVADAFDLANGVSNVTISGFEIRNFAATDFTNGTGVGVQAWVPSTSNITVSDNWFHDVGYGVMVGNDGSSVKYALGTHRNWTVSGNIIENFFSIGVELTDTSNSSVQGNVIHMPGVGVYGQIGIFSWAHISQSGLTVTENTIDGTMVAFPAVYMYAWDDVAPTPNLNDVMIWNNTISTTGSPFQVYLRDIGTGTVTGVHVNYNSLTGLNGLKNLTAVSIDGTKNWWGANDGPSGVGPGSGAAVTANVLFVPWACKPTTGGLAYLTPSAGMIDDLTPVSPPAGAPVSFPYGMFSFVVTGITGQVTLTVELPGPVPVGTKWYKYNGGAWDPLPIGDDDGDNLITVTLTDNNPIHDEDSILGQITDQGGPGEPGAVGWETYPVSKARVMLPWLALLAAILAGAGVLVVRRRRAQT